MAKDKGNTSTRLQLRMMLMTVVVVMISGANDKTQDIQTV
jgi:hypothetical protein